MWCTRYGHASIQEETIETVVEIRNDISIEAIEAVKDENFGEVIILEANSTTAEKVMEGAANQGTTDTISQEDIISVDSEYHGPKVEEIHDR